MRTSSLRGEPFVPGRIDQMRLWRSDLPLIWGFLRWAVS